MTRSSSHSRSIEVLPNEILTQVIKRAGLASVASVLDVSQRWRALGEAVLPDLLKGSSITIEMTQENHWSMRTDMIFAGFDPVFRQVIFQAVRGSGIKLYRFFYAWLVSKPQAQRVVVRTGDGELLVVRPNLPLRLTTKASGIKVCSPVDAHCSFLYTVESNDDLGLRQADRDAHGTRWVTPLSFQCSLNFFSTGVPASSPLAYQDPTSSLVRTTRVLFQTLWPTSPTSGAPSMLYPRSSSSTQASTSPTSSSRPKLGVTHSWISLVPPTNT